MDRFDLTILTSSSILCIVVGITSLASDDWRTGITLIALSVLTTNEISKGGY